MASDAIDRETLKRILLSAAREIAAGRRKMIHPNVELPAITIDRPRRKARKRLESVHAKPKRLAPKQLILI